MPTIGIAEGDDFEVVVVEHQHMPELKSFDLTNAGEADLGRPAERIWSIDVDGDSKAELLVGFEDGSSVLYAIEGTNLRVLLSTDPSGGLNWRKIRGMGSFSGSGASELLLAESDDGSTYRGTFLNSEGKLQFRVAAEVIRLLPNGVVVAGDIDSDGRDEAIVQEPGSAEIPPSCQIWRWDGSRLALGSNKCFSATRGEIEALKDIDADGRVDLLFRRMGIFGYQLLVLAKHDRFATEANLISWAYFPFTREARSVLFGDFNGDGFSDALFLSGGVVGWWLARGFESGATEVELRASNAMKRSRDVVAGDFDRDGRSELIALQDSKLKLISFSEGRPLSGVGLHLRSDAGEQITFSSGADGRARLSLANYAGSEVTPRFDGYHFVPGSFRLPLSNAPTANQQARPIRRIVAVSDSSRAPGQAYGFGGITGPGPFVCVNYSPNTAEWKWRSTESACPSGHGIYSVNEVSSAQQATADSTPVIGACCRLPAEDILTDEHSWASEECPDGSVVTGGAVKWWCLKCEKRVRCTKINAARYQLGEKVPGAYWGRGLSRRSHLKRVERLDIPVAIRYAVGRQGLLSWTTDGCVGLPWGSLAVRKGPPRCSGFLFRQLQYRGLPGDPPRGTPVEMFPKCQEISDIFDPEASCVP